MALTGTVRVVIAEFPDSAPPRVTVKYDLADAANPALGTIVGVERPIEDPALLAAVVAQAEALVPATSALLGLPLALPPGQTP